MKINICTNKKDAKTKTSSLFKDDVFCGPSRNRSEASEQGHTDFQSNISMLNFWNTIFLKLE